MVLVGTAYAATPEDALKAYLAALYARNSPSAYRLISRADRKLKPIADYLREHPSFSGAALQLATVLASHIRYERLRTVVEGDRATVTFKAIVPDANHPAIDALVLGFDEQRLAARSPAERRRIREQIEEMARAGRLPVVTGESERWELRRENGTWHVFLSWAEAPVIRFTAAVKAGLPWSFEAPEPLIRATPGGMLRTSYRVKNLSHRTITAKARDILEPPEASRYLEIISCFCAIEQTLAPGESQELPVVFRVAVDAPRSVSEMSIHYEFYPIDRFPSSHR